MTTASRDGEQTGYRLVLPPGWARIPLRAGTEEAIEQLLDESLAALGPDLPRDRVNPLRSELAKRLHAQARTARDNEGIDLYLPVARVHGKTIAASFVIGLMRFDTVEVPAEEDVLVALAAQSDGARFTEVAGASALRIEDVAAGSALSADAEREYRSRRVTYVIAIPGETDAWLSASFSTIGDGDPHGEVALVLVELFDAVISTLRWLAATAPA